MRKLSILFISFVSFSFVSFSFVGCEENGENYFSNTGEITKFEYEGHTYLMRNAYQKGGICHDENCKCKTDSIK